MSSRRARGDSGLHWDQHRQRWVATATVGYDGRGKRLVGHGYGRTKTEAKASCVAYSRAGLDLAVMLEFLGSLTVALIGSRRLRDLVLALGDLLGFVHRGEPRRGTASARAPRCRPWAALFEVGIRLS